MKTLLHTILLTACLAIPLRAAEDAAALPGDAKLAEWSELEGKKFDSWSIKEYLGCAEPFDGGSKIFGFSSEPGKSFEVILANPAYWTPEEKKAGRQVFFVIHDRLFYRVVPESGGEEILIEKITQAAAKLAGEDDKNSKVLEKLAARLKSRESSFKPKE